MRGKTHCTAGTREDTGIGWYPASLQAAAISMASTNLTPNDMDLVTGLSLLRSKSKIRIVRLCMASISSYASYPGVKGILT